MPLSLSYDYAPRYEATRSPNVFSVPTLPGKTTYGTSGHFGLPDRTRKGRKRSEELGSTVIETPATKMMNGEGKGRGSGFLKGGDGSGENGGPHIEEGGNGEKSGVSAEVVKSL